MEQKITNILDQFRMDLNNLGEYLRDKKPSDEQELLESRSWLLEIEHQMIGAIEKIEDVDVAKTIRKAMDALPDVDTDPTEWQNDLKVASKMFQRI